MLDFDTDPEQAPPPAEVLWYELTPRGFRCQRTPMDVSGPLREHRQRSMAAWVFTSATLTVDGGFAHISQRLGLDDPVSLLQPSPFDWAHQALCYLPTDLPDPAARGFGTALIRALTPVLEASHGRAFLLFASPCTNSGHGASRSASAASRSARPCCSGSASRAMGCCWARPVSARAWTWLVMR